MYFHDTIARWSALAIFPVESARCARSRVPSHMQNFYQIISGKNQNGLSEVWERRRGGENIYSPGEEPRILCPRYTYIISYEFIREISNRNLLQQTFQRDSVPSSVSSCHVRFTGVKTAYGKKEKYIYGTGAILLSVFNSKEASRQTRVAFVVKFWSALILRQGGNAIRRRIRRAWHGFNFGERFDAMMPDENKIKWTLSRMKLTASKRENGRNKQ